MIDEVTITLIAGRGGDGRVSFRRERFVPKGGPDGGDGGKGGDIFLLTTDQLNTLSEFYRRKVFQAEAGEPGKNRKATGRSGQDLILNVPLGTEIWQDQKRLIDLVRSGQKFLICRGGRGGWGNWRFRTATNQAPTIANPGQPGQSKTLRVVLKLIAKVGLIGRPNVGKSSLLSRLSQARPKIADYPFTTLEPNLGVVNPTEFKINAPAFVVADIPGLIEGAHQGKGLGDRFLKHIERTEILVHLLEATRPNLFEDKRLINQELTTFSRQLGRKHQVVAVNKTDLIDEKTQRQLFEQLKTFKPIFISTVTGRGLSDLVRILTAILKGQHHANR